MLFTNVAIFLLVVYFCVAQQLNDQEALSVESSRETGRRFHSSGKATGRRWTNVRNSPYQRVVSSEHEVPETKETDYNITEATESEQSKDKSKKIKRLTSRSHNVSETLEANITRHDLGRGRGHKDYSGTQRRRRITESDFVPSTTSSNKRRRMPTIPTTTNAPQTMSYSLYNYFRPLEQDVPQDDILPFLDFGRKLSPVVPTPSGVNSLENKSTISKLRIHVTEPSVIPTDDETVHEEMDLNFDRRVIERNSVPRGRLNSSPNISNLYRKPTQTTRTADNVINDCVTPPNLTTKKHPRVQDRQIESHKNRSICVTPEVETILPRTTEVSTKQTLRKLKDVEVISNIKTSYKSSELKSRAVIAAEPSNVKAIFKDVQGSDLFNSGSEKVNVTFQNPIDSQPLPLIARTVLPPDNLQIANLTKQNTRDSKVNINRHIVETTTVKHVQDSDGNSTMERHIVETTTMKNVQESEGSATVQYRNKVNATNTLHYSDENSNLQNKNISKFLPREITANNTHSRNYPHHSNKTKDRSVQAKPFIRSNFRHSALAKKVYNPLSQLRIANMTDNLPDNFTKTYIKNTTETSLDEVEKIAKVDTPTEVNLDHVKNIAKVDSPTEVSLDYVKNIAKVDTSTEVNLDQGKNFAKVDTPTEVSLDHGKNIAKVDSPTEASLDLVKNIVKVDTPTEVSLDHGKHISLPKQAENPRINATTAPNSHKPKILSTAVVTSVSVQESNISAPVTESPLNYKVNNANPVSERLQGILVRNVTADDKTDHDLSRDDVLATNNKTNKVKDSTTTTTPIPTTITTPTTTTSTTSTTTQLAANFTTTEVPKQEVTTNITLLIESTTEALVKPETTFIPFATDPVPNLTLTDDVPNTTIQTPTTLTQNLDNKSVVEETNFAPNPIPLETEPPFYDTTIVPLINISEETTLPNVEPVTVPPDVPSTLIPPKGSGTELETAVVKEEKNNTTAVLGDGDSEITQNTLVVPGSDYEDVEVAYQEGIGVTTYILVFLGVVPIVLGATVAGRFLVLHSRKKVLDESEYSSEYNRSPLGIAASPLPTKLPRVPTHLGWEMEKSAPTILPTSSARWEFPREKLRLQTLLGQGNFGQVWKAEADDISGHEGLTRLVAVKTVKESANMREREDLLRELGIMQDLGSHPNVVTLLGCCTEKEPYFLIMEYVMYGKMLAFLRDHRTRAHYYNFSDATDALTSRDLTVFSYCVARGMDYLSNKGIIHRDLAARNILVDHNKLCKIADFGMSRNVRDTGQIYEQRQSKGALPIRWMAPESLHFSLFTHKSDVWSFGILLWEIVTLGSTPYATMGAREVMRRVRDGYRLERPSHCRMEFFRVISKCWHSDPNKRPTFAELKQEIGQLLGDSENGGGYVDLESLADEIKQGVHNSSSLQRKH